MRLFFKFLFNYVLGLLKKRRYLNEILKNKCRIMALIFNIVVFTEFVQMLVIFVRYNHFELLLANN